MLPSLGLSLLVTVLSLAGQVRPRLSPDRELQRLRKPFDAAADLVTLVRRWLALRTAMA
jgi:hypothetical protein